MFPLVKEIQISWQLKGIKTLSKNWNLIQLALVIKLLI
jgi:hypothetical protein